MFQDMGKMFEESMSPFKEIVDIQTKMLERLTKQQIECTQACFQATIQQAMELQNVKSPADLANLHNEYTKKLERMLASANEQNVQSLRDAHEAIQKLTLNAADALNSSSK